MTALIFFLLLMLAALVCFSAVQLSFASGPERKIRYHREFSDHSVYAGRWVRLTETVENGAARPVALLLTETTLPGALTPEQGRPRSGRYALRTAAYLPGKRTMTLCTDLHCTHRGCYDLGGGTVVLQDLFGLSRRRRKFEQRDTLYVYPALVEQADLPDALLRFQGDVTARRWILPDPILIAGIREYQSGDPLRDVHWNATARTGELQVKVRDHTVSPRILLVINAACRPGLWGNMEPEEQELCEPLLCLAATLLNWTVANGLDCGLCANTAAEPGMETAYLYLPPKAGYLWFEEQLRALARMELQCRVDVSTMLRSLRDRGMSGMDLAVLSRYLTPDMAEVLADLRRQGNTVTLLGREEGGAGQ